MTARLVFDISTLLFGGAFLGAVLVAAGAHRSGNGVAAASERKRGVGGPLPHHYDKVRTWLGA